MYFNVYCQKCGGLLDMVVTDKTVYSGRGDINNFSKVAGPSVTETKYQCTNCYAEYEHKDIVVTKETLIASLIEQARAVGNLGCSVGCDNCMMFSEAGIRVPGSSVRYCRGLVLLAITDMIKKLED